MSIEALPRHRVCSLSVFSCDFVSDQLIDLPMSRMVETKSSAKPPRVSATSHVKPIERQLGRLEASGGQLTLDAHLGRRTSAGREAESGTSPAWSFFRGAVDTSRHIPPGGHQRSQQHHDTGAGKLAVGPLASSTGMSGTHDLGGEVQVWERGLHLASREHEPVLVTLWWGLSSMAAERAPCRRGISMSFQSGRAEEEAMADTVSSKKIAT